MRDVSSPHMGIQVQGDGRMRQAVEFRTLAVVRPLERRVALVTGGVGAIGRAVALALADAGARVVVSACGNDGEQTVEKIKEDGGKACFLEADLTCPADVRALIDRSIIWYGRLDFAFNGTLAPAGPGGLTDCTEEQWDQTIALNLKSVWLRLKYEVTRLAEYGGGAIVNQCSTAGLVGVPGLVAATASEHGILGLTKAAALESARQGVRINAVCSGIDCHATDAGPGGSERGAPAQPASCAGSRTPEDTAAAVLWLCSDGATTVTGQAIALGGGFAVH